MNHPKNPHYNKNNIARRNPPEWWIKFRTKLSTNRVLAIATAVLALAGMWQAWVSRDTEKRDLRAYAYLTFERAYVAADTMGGRINSAIFYSNFVAHNSGHTPAYDIRLYLRTDVMPIGTRPYFDSTYPQYISSLGSLYPGVSPGPIVGIDTLTATDIGVLRTGRGKLYAWGWIKYNDAFGDSHETTFRFENSNVSYSLGVPNVMAQSETGNESD